jgi:hypothetical protein
VLNFAGPLGGFVLQKYSSLMYSTNDLSPEVESGLIKSAMEWVAAVSPPREQNCQVYLDARLFPAGKSLLYHALISNRPAFVSAVLSANLQDQDGVREDIVRFFADSFSAPIPILEILADFGFDFGIIHQELNGCPLEIILSRSPSLEMFDFIFRAKPISPPGSSTNLTLFQRCLLRYPRWGPFSRSNVTTVVAKCFENSQAVRCPLSGLFSHFLTQIQCRSS